MFVCERVTDRAQLICTFPAVQCLLSCDVQDFATAVPSIADTNTQRYENTHTPTSTQCLTSHTTIPTDVQTVKSLRWTGVPQVKNNPSPKGDREKERKRKSGRDTQTSFADVFMFHS